MREPDHIDTVPTAWMPHWLVIAFLSAVLWAGLGQVASQTGHESAPAISDTDSIPPEKQLAQSSAALSATPADPVPSQTVPPHTEQVETGQVETGQVETGQVETGQVEAAQGPGGQTPIGQPRSDNRPKLTGEPTPERQ